MPYSVLVWLAILFDCLALPFFLYLLVVSFAAFLARRGKQVVESPPHRFQIVIPAHDEEVGIAQTVRSCLDVDYPRGQFEVLVIADNCTDRTAELAGAAGANVLTRTHPTDRAKGYALEYHFDRLVQSGEMDRFDALVVIDADTTIDRRLLNAFSWHLARGSDWVQAYYTVANWDDTWRTRLMTLSFGLINGIQLLGQWALGLSAGFRGNGMCFATRGLRKFPWRIFGLVEDIEYSWTLRVRGETVAFAPDVTVRATMPTQGGGGAVSQRRRWEFGRSEVRRRMVVPILRSSSLGPGAKLAALFELLMPPLVTLALAFVLMTTFNILAQWILNGSGGPDRPPILLTLNGLAAIGLFLYGIAPFVLLGMPWKILASLAYFPVFVFWKLSRTFGGKPREWVRTEREIHTDAAAASQVQVDAPSGAESGQTAS